MSHFSVMVIGENVVKQLEPYQENNMDDCPKQYLKFVDKEKEFLKQYKSGKCKRLVHKNGLIESPYDKKYKVFVPGKQENFLFSTSSDDKFEYPVGSKVKNVPFKLVYKTFEEFVKGWHGYEKKDKVKDKFGYWENPNKKWDWYQVGGRWNGFFKLNVCGIGKGKLGEAGTLTTPCKDITRADMAYLRDIDFEYMKEESAEKAAKEWDEVHTIVNGLESPKPWKYFFKLYKKNYEKTNAAYRNQPAIEKLYSKSIFCELDDFFNQTRESFIEKQKLSAISPFAIVKDGKWYERGSMSWFGVVIKEKDKYEWDKQFSKLISGLPKDTLMTIVDCHI